LKLQIIGLNVGNLTSLMEVQGFVVVHIKGLTILSLRWWVFLWSYNFLKATLWLLILFFVKLILVGRRTIMGFIANYPDYELRIAKNDQFWKVFMVVTCVNFYICFEGVNVLLGHFSFWLLLGHFSILNKLAKLNINLLEC